MIKYLVFERYILRHLEDQGQETASVRKRLSEHSLNRLERLRLLAGHATEVCDDPSLGLRIGLKVSPMAYGVLGQAIMHSATLLDAQRFLLKHMWVLDPSAREPAQLQVTSNFVQINYLAPPVWPELPTFILDLFFASVLKQARDLTSTSVTGASLRLKRDKPRHAADMQDILGIPLQFGAELDQISMPREISEAPLMASTITLSSAYRKQCDDLLGGMRRSTSRTERIRQYVMLAPKTDISISEIAAQLNTTERTLRRQLKAEGSSFRTIRQDVRHHLAQKYLVETQLSVADISDLLGYFDAATFSRAFIDWTGMTPRTYRQENAAFA